MGPNTDRSGTKALISKAPVVAPYLGASYGVEDKLRAIGGASIAFSRNWSSILIHDGVNFHPTVTGSWKNHDFTLMWVNTEDLGFSWSVRF